jgi:hypothetical protein
MDPETRDLADPTEEFERNIKFRLEAGAGGDHGGIYGLVSALSEAYRNFYAWDVIVSQAELDSLENGHSRETPVKQLSSYAASVPAEDELRIEKTNSTSPVTFEITGAPGPLKKLQGYLAKRHVDWDREGKEPSEDKRLELEEQRIDAVRKQVDLLNGLGFPEIQIREALSEYIFGPLDRLERYTQIKFFSGGEMQTPEKSAREPQGSDER